MKRLKEYNSPQRKCLKGRSWREKFYCQVLTKMCKGTNFKELEAIRQANILVAFPNFTHLLLIGFYCSPKSALNSVKAKCWTSRAEKIMTLVIRLSLMLMMSSTASKMTTTSKSISSSEIKQNQSWIADISLRKVNKICSANACWSWRWNHNSKTSLWKATSSQGSIRRKFCTIEMCLTLKNSCKSIGFGDK